MKEYLKQGFELSVGFCFGTAFVKTIAEMVLKKVEKRKENKETTKTDTCEVNTEEAQV